MTTRSQKLSKVAAPKKKATKISQKRDLGREKSSVKEEVTQKDGSYEITILLDEEEYEILQVLKAREPKKTVEQIVMSLLENEVEETQIEGTS